MSLFGGRSKHALDLILDIGSASVGAALVAFEKGDTPLILYSTRKPMVFQKELDFVRFRDAMEKALYDACRDVAGPGVRSLKFTPYKDASPRAYHATFSAPWYALETRTFAQESDGGAFDVSNSLVERLAEKEIDAFKKSEGVHEHIGSGEVDIVEKHIAQVRLNGYETTDLDHKNARALEGVVLVSLMPRDVMTRVTNQIRRVFHITEGTFRTFGVTAFDTLRGLKGIPANDEFIFVDVSGEVSDVTVVREGVIRKNRSFPVGRNNIIRGLAQALHTTPEEATSLLRLLAQGAMDKEYEKKIRGSLQQVEHLWLRGFQDALVRASTNLAVPSVVYFTADEDLEAWFAALIRKEEFSQFTMTDEPFSVHAVNIPFLHNVCRFAEGVRRDPFIVLESVFAYRLHTAV